MSQESLPLVAALPAVLVLLMISARAILTHSDASVAAWVRTALPTYDSALDWALHFSVGTMILGISTAFTIEQAASPIAVIGLFTGVFAACIAFVMARPPVRPDAPNPEMDGRSFGLSAITHSVLGVGLASLLIAAS